MTSRQGTGKLLSFFTVWYSRYISYFVMPPLPQVNLVKDPLRGDRDLEEGEYFSATSIPIYEE